MKIAIVIPVLNQVNYFTETVQSIFDTFPKEHELLLTVVDGGSTDPVEQALDSLRPCAPSPSTIQYENIGEGKGVTVPWNIGLKKAMAWGADVVCISNSDVVYGRRAIERTAEVALAHGCAFPLSIQGGPKPENFEALVDERINIGGQILVNTGGFAGWSFFLSRETVEKIGIFDEQFTLWWQDTDYHRRLRDAGLIPWEVRSCLIHHWESVSIKALKNGFEHKGWRAQDQINFERKYPK